MEELIMLAFFTVITVLIALIAVITSQFIIAKKFEKIAFEKGYGTEIHSFAMCFWLGLIGYIYVLALPDLVARSRNISPVPPSDF